jgi:hypothetical protein
MQYSILDLSLDHTQDLGFTIGFLAVGNGDLIQGRLHLRSCVWKADIFRTARRMTEHCLRQ